jgi:tartrate dehydratase beta subunit/fumarate hydratase class I family protein
VRQLRIETFIRVGDIVYIEGQNMVKRLSQKEFAKLLKTLAVDKDAPKTKTENTSIYANTVDHREASYKQTYKAE